MLLGCSILTHLSALLKLSISISAYMFFMLCSHSMHAIVELLSDVHEIFGGLVGFNLALFLL
jgi:hypothetical protein